MSTLTHFALACNSLVLKEVLVVMFENDNEHDFNLVIDMHTKLNDLGIRIRKRAELILDVEKQGYSEEVLKTVKLLKDLQETDNAKARSFMKVINETELKILEKISLTVQFRTDKSKITRKQSKSSKHGHENQKSSKRSQRFKAEARKVKPQSNPVKEKPIIGQQKCPQLDQTATNEAQMIEEMIGQD
ncbi:hypothetical protein Tco_1055142 [Tanacetum coccineum]|uniref:Uncharacterized protein n=1 Tax=Tanacetum coccineum TaxID=301880 RepID=A0ABQ5GZJ2_9ASTR